MLDNLDFMVLREIKETKETLVVVVQIVDLDSKGIKESEDLTEYLVIKNLRTIYYKWSIKFKLSLNNFHIRCE